MKKYLAIIEVFFILIIFSCNRNTEQRILGYWKLEKVKTNQYIKNKNEYSAAMRQMIKTTSIQFLPDKRFGASIWNDTSFGSWQIIGDSLFISDNSNKQKFGVKILKLKRDRLVLLEQADSVSEVLTFIR